MMGILAQLSPSPFPNKHIFRISTIGEQFRVGPGNGNAIFSSSGFFMAIHEIACTQWLRDFAAVGKSKQKYKEKHGRLNYDQV